MSDCDLVIIGAGVVGLAIARAAALRGVEVMVIETMEAPGMVTSSRNSEVIHAGIYYPPGSLKAQLCVEGRRALYPYLERKGIAHQRIGKLIVATDAAEAEQLDTIAARARENGLGGPDALTLLSARELKAKEPELHGVAALWSPSTGIMDAHGYMQALQGDAEAHGAQFIFRSTVDDLTLGPPHQLTGVSQGEGFTLNARRVVIAAGLHSARLARVAGLDAPAWPQDYWLKGNYMTLSGRGPFSHLVYPVPVPGGLGVHATLDLSGGTRFGPDTEPVAVEDYSVDPARVARFETAIRCYWPGLPSGALVPGYAGIRPKLRADTGNGDFHLIGPEQTGVPGVLTLLGIESPGLTSSLALADAACDALAL